MEGLDHDQDVLRARFGDLSSAELAEFLAEVYGQMRADLAALDTEDGTSRATALHRIAGSAPPMGCLQLGALARAAMGNSLGDLEPVRSSGHRALAWLDGLMRGEMCLIKESQE